MHTSKSLDREARAPHLDEHLCDDARVQPHPEAAGRVCGGHPVAEAQLADLVLAQSRVARKGGGEIAGNFLQRLAE